MGKVLRRPGMGMGMGKVLRRQPPKDGHGKSRRQPPTFRGTGTPAPSLPPLPNCGNRHLPHHPRTLRGTKTKWGKHGNKHRSKRCTVSVLMRPIVFRSASCHDAGTTKSVNKGNTYPEAVNLPAACCTASTKLWSTLSALASVSSGTNEVRAASIGQAETAVGGAGDEGVPAGRKDY